MTIKRYGKCFSCWNQIKQENGELSWWGRNCVHQRFGGLKQFFNGVEVEIRERCSVGHFWSWGMEEL